MSAKPYKIWFNGEFVSWDEANVHVLTHTLHYGLAVFEGIRAYKCDDSGSAVFRLSDHIDRLFASAHIAEIKIPFTKEQTHEAIMELLQVNELVEAYIRPIAFIGGGALLAAVGVVAREIPASYFLWDVGSRTFKALKEKFDHYRYTSVNQSAVLPEQASQAA